MIMIDCESKANMLVNKRPLDYRVLRMLAVAGGQAIFNTSDLKKCNLTSDQYNSALSRLEREGFIQTINSQMGMIVILTAEGFFIGGNHE